MALAPGLLISPLGELRGGGRRDIITATVIINEFTVQVKIMPASVRVIKLKLRHCSVYVFVIVKAPMVMSSHLCHHHPHYSHSCRGSEGFGDEMWQNSSNFAFWGVNFWGLAQYEVSVCRADMTHNRQLSIHPQNAAHTSTSQDTQNIQDTTLHLPTLDSYSQNPRIIRAGRELQDPQIQPLTEHHMSSRPQH